MDSICQRICELLCQFGIELVSVRRPGVDNVLADGLSIVGIIPRVAAVQLLKAVLLRKRADPQLSCAFLVPYRHRFNERWGSFHRYYRQLSPRVAARG